MERSNEDLAHTGALPAAAPPAAAAGTEAVPAPDAVAPAGERPEWVRARRAELTRPGRYLLYEDSGSQLVHAITRQSTRVGRSLSADLRFDDATVSRRHALVVDQDDGVRVLDDRSLNGIFVNGRRVEWSPLRDGDEISIGRHRLFYHDTATVGSAGASTSAALAE